MRINDRVDLLFWVTFEQKAVEGLCWGWLAVVTVKVCSHFFLCTFTQNPCLPTQRKINKGKTECLQIAVIVFIYIKTLSPVQSIQLEQPARFHMKGTKKDTAISIFSTQSIKYFFLFFNLKKKNPIKFQTHKIQNRNKNIWCLFETRLQCSRHEIKKVFCWYCSSFFKRCDSLFGEADLVILQRARRNTLNKNTSLHLRQSTTDR